MTGPSTTADQRRARCHACPAPATRHVMAPFDAARTSVEHDTRHNVTVVRYRAPASWLACDEHVSKQPSDIGGGST